MLEIKDAQIDFIKEKKPLMQELNLKVSSGSMLVVMGKSGAGKSTLLAWLAGYLNTSVFSAKGKIILDGQDITYKSIQQRRVGVLFQEHLLFPHMTVMENLAYSYAGKEKVAKKKEILEEHLEKVKLAGFCNRMPETLSGGERARASLLRTLISEPNYILLDEPFSKLDAKLKSKMRQFFFEELAKRNIPIVMVTHDEEDAPDSKEMLSQKLLIGD